MRFLCGILAGLFLHGGIYLRPATVREVRNESIIAETHDGTLWEFYADSCEVGDALILLMDDCGTENIYDDEIVGVF